MPTQSKQHSAIITLVGAPNAGKSTLLNKIIGGKISIVTPKAQTTRVNVKGAIVINDSQLVFIDTPGIFQPKRQLEQSMVKAAWSGLKHVDFAALLVDARRGICKNTRMIIKGMNERNGRFILLLNKVDSVKKEKLLTLAMELDKEGIFEQIFMISAKTGDGISDFTNYLAENSPEGDWLYPEDQMTDLPVRMLASEITREKLMMRLNQELPYQLMVETESWEEKEDSIKINQVIYVSSEGQKKIVIGDGGKILREIGERTRLELSHMLEKKVSLFIFVKIKENWQTSPEHYKMMGLEL